MWHFQNQCQTEYPRYNGRDAPLPYDELDSESLNLAALNPENEQEFEIAENPELDFAELDPQQGGFASETFFEPEEDMEAISNLSAEILEDEEEVDLTPRNAAEFALTKEQVHISYII